MCLDGWGGQKCDKSTQALVNGQRQNNQIIAAGEWQYWRYTTTGKDLVVISLKELGPRSESSGFLYVYVKEASQPTLISYDYVDIDTNKGFHTITIRDGGVSRVEHRTTPVEWVIGVFGSPFVNGPMPYSVVGM